MTLPPRPEPECIHAGLGGEWSDLIFGERDIRKHIKYCEENPSVENWWEPLFTIDQLKARELEIIEACKAVCSELEEYYADYCNTALLNGDVALSVAASGEGRACRAVISAIDKLKDQL